MLERPITIKQIAQLLNISLSTVSRALNGQAGVSSVMRDRIRQLAQELSYEPNKRAIFFQQGKTYSIGVILPELSETFFSSALTTIEETAYEKNYTILLAQSHDDPEREKQIVQKMKSQRVDGILISLAKGTTSFEYLDELKKQNIPVIFFDRIPPIEHIHYVTCNIQAGTVLAVGYLLQRGHRVVGMINGPSTLLASKERKKGYQEAMFKNRLKFDSSLNVNCDLSQQSSVDAFEKLLKNKRKPTAIITFNDHVALYIIKHARKIGLEINGDIELVTYSNLPILDYMKEGPIASVEQFPEIQARRATESLIDIINWKNRGDEQSPYYKVIIEPHLVEKKR